MYLITTSFRTVVLSVSLCLWPGYSAINTGFIVQKSSKSTAISLLGNRLLHKAIAMLRHGVNMRNLVNGTISIRLLTSNQFNCVNTVYF